MYWELLNTVLNTKRWNDGIQELLIHPDTLREFISEAREIVPSYEIKATDNDRMCDIPIKTSRDCQVDKIYFGFRY